MVSRFAMLPRCVPGVPGVIPGANAPGKSSAATQPSTMVEHHQVATSGGNVAKTARLELERKTGRKVISPLNASDTAALDVEAPNDTLPPPEGER